MKNIKLQSRFYLHELCLSRPSTPGPKTATSTLDSEFCERLDAEFRTRMLRSRAQLSRLFFTAFSFFSADYSKKVNDIKKK